MNPLNNGNNQGLPPELQQSINQVKGLMGIASGNPNQMFEQLGKQNPMFNQVLQMCNGQNPEQVFYSMCKRQGIDAEQVIKHLMS